MKRSSGSGIDAKVMSLQEAQQIIRKRRETKLQRCIGKTDLMGIAAETQAAADIVLTRSMRLERKLRYVEEEKDEFKEAYVGASAEVKVLDKSLAELAVDYHTLCAKCCETSIAYADIRRKYESLKARIALSNSGGPDDSGAQNSDVWP